MDTAQRVTNTDWLRTLVLERAVLIRHAMYEAKRETNPAMVNAQLRAARSLAREIQTVLDRHLPPLGAWQLSEVDRPEESGIRRAIPPPKT